jgi:hypothetical protein
MRKNAATVNGAAFFSFSMCQAFLRQLQQGNRGLLRKLMMPKMLCIIKKIYNRLKYHLQKSKMN